MKEIEYTNSTLSTRILKLEEELPSFVTQSNLEDKVDDIKQKIDLTVKKTTEKYCISREEYTKSN